MSRIDDLIKNLCPDGVPQTALGDLLDYEQPGKYLVSSTAYDPSYPTPVLTAGRTFVLGHTDETDGIYPASKEEPVVIFDDFTTAFRWVDFPFKAKSSAMKMLRPKPGAAVEFKYIWYAMHLIGFVPASHSRHWISQFSKCMIPVPPPEIQAEVVRILDSFELLEANLKVELEAELEARNVQYKHYREDLFAFSESMGIRRIPMGELGQFVRGNGLQKRDLAKDGSPAIHYGQVHTTYGTWTAETKWFVSPTLATKLRKAKPGDLVIATTSEDDGAVGKAVAWIGQDEAAVSGDAYIYRHSLDPKYVAYFFQTEDFQIQKKSSITGTKVRRISGSALAQILIPVPAPEEQRRIAAVLDEFSALVEELSTALPAEHRARRAQYEYYRDQLLKFEEISA